MPRPITTPARTAVPPDEVPVYDRIIAQFGGLAANAASEQDPGPFYGPLLNSPQWAANRAQLSTLIRTAGERGDSYSHFDREWADQVLAVHLRTNIVLRTHLPDAIAVGVRVEAIEALRAGRDSDLNEDELLLARFIRQVVDGELTDEVFSALEQRIGTRGVVEYIMFVTTLAATMRQIQAFGGSAPSDEDVEKVLDDFKRGIAEKPDWRKRIR
jgi:hypothetical protein